MYWGQFLNISARSEVYDLRRLAGQKKFRKYEVYSKRCAAKQMALGPSKIHRFFSFWACCKGLGEFCQDAFGANATVCYRKIGKLVIDNLGLGMIHLKTTDKRRTSRA